MTDDKRHPDRIWAASEGGAKWYYGYWDLGGQSDLNNEQGAIATAALAVSRAALRQDEGRE